MGYQAGILYHSSHIAHAAAKFDSIGGHYGIYLAALIGEGYASCHISSFIKRKSSQVDPRSASHLLIDPEDLAASFVVDGISRIPCAQGQAGIGNVYGVFTCFGDVGYPLGKSRLHNRFFIQFGIVGNNPAVSSHPERIVITGIDFFLIRKTAVVLLVGAPQIRTSLFAVSAFRIIVIHYHLVDLCITLPRKHDDGSRIFQHGSQERQYVGHGIEIFHGLEQAGALPFPPGQFLFVIQSVAMPQGYVPVL